MSARPNSHDPRDPHDFPLTGVHRAYRREFDSYLEQPAIRTRGRMLALVALMRLDRPYGTRRMR